MLTEVRTLSCHCLESPEFAGALCSTEIPPLGDVIVDGTDGRFTVAEQGLWTQIYETGPSTLTGAILLRLPLGRHWLTDGNIARAHLSERTGCPGGLKDGAQQRFCGHVVPHYVQSMGMTDYRPA
jgi:hypothetical protein